MSILTSVWTYVISFGTLGFICLGLLLWPTTAVVAQEFLKPVAAAFGRWAAVIIAYLQDGFMPLIQKMSTVCCVLLLMAATGCYFHAPKDTAESCKQTIAQLHKDYKFEPRQKKTVGSTVKSWFSWL